MHTINKKTDSIPSLDNLSQSNTITQIVYSKQDIMRLFQDCFQGLIKLQGEPYYTEVDPSAPPKKTPCRPVPVHKEAYLSSRNARHAAGIIKSVDHATPWINSFVIAA